MTEWHWPASRLTRVVDGDSYDTVLARTFAALPGDLIDVGFGACLRVTSCGCSRRCDCDEMDVAVKMPVRLRLNRVNAPKLNSPRGATVAAAVTARTLGVDLEITTIKPYKYGGPRDRVGEYMAEIVLPDGDNLSDFLVREGLAVYWDGQGPRPADE